MFYSTSLATLSDSGSNSTIPGQTTYFQLGGCHFTDKSDLSRIIEKMPDAVKYFALEIPTVRSDTYVTQLSEAFASLQPSIQTLDVCMSKSFLTQSNDTTTRTSAFDKLPENITTLRLSFSYDLGDIDTLIALCALIPRTVKKLILSLELLPQTEDIKKALEQIAEIRGDDCSFGLEWQYKAVDIKKLVFQVNSIGKEKITSFIINDALFGMNKLFPGIRSIPDNITSIVLPKNILQLPSDELRNFFDAIPLSVTEFDCINNSPKPETTAEILHAILNAALPFDRTLHFINLRVEGNQIIHYKHEAAMLETQKDDMPETVQETVQEVIQETIDDEEKQDALIKTTTQLESPSNLNTTVQEQLEPNVMGDKQKEPSLTSDHNRKTPEPAKREAQPSKHNQFFKPISQFTKEDSSPNTASEDLQPDDDISHTDEPSSSANLQFMLNILNAPKTQFAALALGAVILLACSGAGLIALGAGLALFGGIGLAKHAYDKFNTPSQTGDTGHQPT